MKPFTANKLLQFPPAKWQATAEKVHPMNWNNDDLFKFASGLAEHFARMAAYFNARYVGKTHADAVKESQRVVTALRKALRFSYPEDTLSF